MLPLTTGSVETTLLLFVPSGIVAMRIEGTVTSSLNSPIVFVLGVIDNNYRYVDRPHILIFQITTITNVTGRGTKRQLITYCVVQTGCRDVLSCKQLNAVNAST